MAAIKTAVVTGAGAGIGAAIARRLAAEGLRVVVAELNGEAGRGICQAITDAGGVATFVETDVTDLAQVRAMISGVLNSCGRVDVLVNNAYPIGAFPAPAIEQDEARLHTAMRGGFEAAVVLMKAVYPEMARNRWGRIINICSLNGVNAHPGTVEYNTAKEALRAYTRTIAVEWASDGITANIICPGARTNAYKQMEKLAPEMLEGILKLVPMGYMGDPDRDIAPVASFLASDGAGYMTGNTLFVDGGGHINGVPWKP